MTAHSPVGLHPERFQVKILNGQPGTFANNDIDFEHEKGIDFNKFSDGLKTSLFNYMQGAGFDLPLQKWFDFKIPSAGVDKKIIQNILEQNELHTLKWNQKIYWLGTAPGGNFFTKSKKGRTWEMIEIVMDLAQEKIKFSLSKDQGIWLLNTLQSMQMHHEAFLTLQMLKEDYEQQEFEEDFEWFWYNKVLKNLKGKGLISL
jgi:hypothetical protein